MIQDLKKWDGKGSPPEAVEKSGTPLPSTLLDWLIYKLIDCVMCYLYVYVCVSLVPGRVASWVEASPGKIRVPIQSNPNWVANSLLRSNKLGAT